MANVVWLSLLYGILRRAADSYRHLPAFEAPMNTFPTEVDKGRITEPRPTGGANVWFVSLADEREGMVTSTIQFQP